MPIEPTVSVDSGTLGGWENLQGSDGTRFANQRECVAYAVQSGMLEPGPIPTLTQFAPCSWSVTGTGFEQFVHYRVELHINGNVTSTP